MFLLELAWDSFICVWQYSSSYLDAFRFLKSIKYAYSLLVHKCGPLLMSPASLLNTIQLFLLFCVPLSPSYTVITIFILISMVLVSLKGQEKRMWCEILFQSLPVILPWVAEKGLSSDGNLLSSGWTQKAYASPPCRYEGTGHSIKIDNLAFCVLTTDPEQQNMLQSWRQNWSGSFFFHESCCSS